MTDEPKKPDAIPAPAPSSAPPQDQAASALESAAREAAKKTEPATTPAQPAPQKRPISFLEFLGSLPEDQRTSAAEAYEKDVQRRVQAYHDTLKERGLLTTGSDGAAQAPSQPGPPSGGHDEDAPLTRAEYQREKAVEARQQQAVATLRAVVAEKGWTTEQQSALLAFLEKEEQRGPDAEFSRKDLLRKAGILAAARAAGLDQPTAQANIGPGGLLQSGINYGAIPDGMMLNAQGRLVQKLVPLKTQEGTSLMEAARQRALEAVAKKLAGR